MNDRLITHLDPALQSLCRQFLINCHTDGINAIITETYRSSADQDAYYAHGRTLSGHIITNARGGQSPHNYTLPDGSPGSKAFDFAIVGADGILDWDASNTSWQHAIKIGETLGLVSGSTFHSIKDSSHMELPNWKIISLPLSNISLTNQNNVWNTTSKATSNQGAYMPLSSWKTIIVSISTMILGVLQSMGYTDLVSQHPGAAVTVMGVVFFILRLITNTAAGISVSLNPKLPVVSVSPTPPVV